MATSLDPLPLESRPRDPASRAQGSVFRLSGVSAVAQVGLCLAVLGLPIYVALMLIPANPRLAWYEKTTAGFGVAAMATLSFLCVSLLRRAPWSRAGMAAFCTVLLAWECLKLPVALFVYAPARGAVLSAALSEQLAATTQPTTRPAQFDSFLSIGVYLMPLLTFLALGGFAWWSLRVMRGTQARAILGR